MPYFLAIGVTKYEFFHSTPNMLRAYLKSYKIRQKMRDEEMWLHNRYTLDALMVALSHFGAGLAGKKSEATYPGKPCMQEKVVQKNLSEEEKQKYVDQFFAQEAARRVNWNRKHSKNNGE